MIIHVDCFVQRLASSLVFTGLASGISLKACSNDGKRKLSISRVEWTIGNTKCGPSMLLGTLKGQGVIDRTILSIATPPKYVYLQSARVIHYV